MNHVSTNYTKVMFLLMSLVTNVVFCFSVNCRRKLIKFCIGSKHFVLVLSDDKSKDKKISSFLHSSLTFVLAIGNSRIL